MRGLWIALVCTAACASPPSDLVDVDGKPVDPFARGGVEAFVFVRSDCPIANRYAPELKRLDEAFARSEARLWLVYPDPMETAVSIRAHLEAFSLPTRALRDPRHTLVARAGVSVTPEAAVFDARGALVYQGRIDDRFPIYGAQRPATTSELRSAVEATLAGKAFEPATTEAVGCYIADLE